jgi:hypothetical protein
MDFPLPPPATETDFLFGVMIWILEAHMIGFLAQQPAVILALFEL